MPKYKVIVARTMFMIKEVEANSEDEAEELAWETNPTEWENSFLSSELEQYQVLDDTDSEYTYWN